MYQQLSEQIQTV